MIIRCLLAGVLLCLLQACGEGTTGDNTPPSLTIIGSNLDQFNGIVPTNVRSIEIQVSEALDVTSVNGTTVFLMPGASHATGSSVEPSDPTGSEDSGLANDADPTGSMDVIDGDVRYDAATGTIYFSLRKPLDEGQTYHLRIQGVRLADGRTPASSSGGKNLASGVLQLVFATTHSHEVTRVRYDDQGNETAYVTFRVENNIRQERRQYDQQRNLKFVLQYNKPLPPPSVRTAKLLYRNASDEITQYDYDIVENGVVTATLRVKDAGADNVWGTDDDFVVSWTQHNEQHLNHDITRTYTLVDRSQKVVWNGPDTPGFQLRTIFLQENGGFKTSRRDIFYRDLGEDGVIDTDPATQEIIRINDNVSLWHKRDFVNGKRVRSWSIGGVGVGEGADGILFTNDDIATGLSTYEYYPEDGSFLAGRLKKLVTYYQRDFKQPMNTWLVDEVNNIVRADAPVHSYRIFTYDAFGNRQEQLTYSPGPDGIMASEAELASGLADDYLTQRITYSTVPTIDGAQVLGLP